MAELNDILAEVIGARTGPSLEDRIRSAFSVSEEDEIEGLLRDKASNIKFSEGVDAQILYFGKREQPTMTRLPDGSTARRIEQVDVVDTDPSLGKPVGIRRPDGDVLIGKDEELSEMAKSVKDKRQELVKELRSSGEVLSFADRIEPGFKLTEDGVIGNLENEFGQGNVIRIGDNDGNLVVMRPGQPPALTDVRGRPEIADIADVGGDIIESGLSFLGQLGATAISARRGAPLGAAASAGIGAASDTAANIAAQAISEALPGEDFPGKTFQESIPERALRAGIGAAGGAGGELVGRVLGGIAKKGAVSARARLGRKVLGELKEKAPLSGVGGTGGDFLKEAVEIENFSNEMIGKRLGLSPGQSTASRKALIRENTLAQLPETTDAMNAAQRERLVNGAEVLDAVVAKVAADPSALGREAVGEQVADAATKHISNLRAVRTAKAAPLYAAAEAEVGKFIPSAPITSSATDLLDRFDRLPTVARALRKTMSALDVAKDKSGNVGIKEINKELKYWTDIAGGQTTPFNEIDRAAQKRVARTVLSSIDEAMDASGAGGTETLRAARATWRKHSQEINGVNTKLMRKIFQLNADASDEQVVKSIISAPKKQVRTLMAALDKSDWGKESAKQLRAQVIRDIMEKGGKTGAARPFGTDLLSRAPIAPGKMVTALSDHADLLGELFSGDKVTKNRLRLSLKMFDRLSLGPGFRGSQTAPTSFDISLMKNIKSKGPISLLGEKVAGSADKILSKIGEKGGLKLSQDDIAKAISTPDGIEALYNLAQAQTNPFRARATEKGARAIVHFLNIVDREENLK